MIISAMPLLRMVVAVKVEVARVAGPKEGLEVAARRKRHLNPSLFKSKRSLLLR